MVFYCLKESDSHILLTFNEAMVSDSFSSQDGFPRASHAKNSDPTGLLLQLVEFLPDPIHKLWSANKHHRPLWYATFTEDCLHCYQMRPWIEV